MQPVAFNNFGMRLFLSPGYTHQNQSIHTPPQETVSSMISNKNYYVTPCRFLLATFALGLSAASLFFTGCATLAGDTQYQVLQARNKVSPALVHVRPVKELFAAGTRTEVLTVGSGFIISPDGYVVTNEHVAGESRQVTCVLGDNTELEAHVVGVDPETDIAVLKLSHSAPFPFVKLGRSAEMESGQMVLAMGSPHGLARSASLGIVSVPDRYLGDSDGLTSPYNNWIQTDAAINPGNSGGPLVNLRGEVIGINARALGGAENVGFAIPMDIAREVIDAIIQEGRVRRSWLGLSFQEMSAKTDDPTLQGVVISDVAPLSPAHEAQVRPGDVLLRVNDAPVHARFPEDLPAIRKTIADLPVGVSAHLLLARGDETVEFHIVTEEKVSLRGRHAEFTEWAFTATELTPELARRAQMPGRTGVLVLGSLPGGIAGQAGLSQGDIILEMDNRPIHTLVDFTQHYETLLETRQRLVLLFVRRGALTRYVMINTEATESPRLEKEMLDYVD